MLLLKDGTTNYADDNTPYSRRNGIHNVIYGLEQASDILSKWFIGNNLKTNLDKYHVLFGETTETQLIVENVPNASSSCEKLLGIKIDQKRSFESHADSLCKKTVKNSMHGTDDLFFKVETKKIIIKRIYYSPILLCTSYLDVLF